MVGPDEGCPDSGPRQSSSHSAWRRPRHHRTIAGTGGSTAGAPPRINKSRHRGQVRVLAVAMVVLAAERVLVVAAMVGVAASTTAMEAVAVAEAAKAR